MAASTARSGKPAAKAAPASTGKKTKTLITPIFRVSFPNVFEARQAMGEGEPKFGLTAVFDPSKFSSKDKERWKAMQALANEVSTSKFKKKISELPDNFKKPVRKGEEKEGLAGFGPGLLFASLTTKFKPGIVDKDGRTEIVDDNDAVYPGCYMRAEVTCYAYDNKGKGVAFGLQNLQKVADGPRLDSRTDASDAFADEEISEEDQRWLDEQEAAAGRDDSDDDSEEDDEDGGF